VLLSVFAIACLMRSIAHALAKIAAATELSMSNLKPIDLSPRGSDTAHALAWGAGRRCCADCGHRGRQPWLQGLRSRAGSYAGATVFSAFGLGYRYSMWLRRPPTRLYWFRGWQMFPATKQIARKHRAPSRNFLEQRRAAALHRAPLPTRWTAHWFLAWGCLLAAAVTFPLSFGWIRFETAPDNQAIYRAFVFGIHVGSFPLDSLIAPLAFNILDICAVMVLIGVL
jgi:hypothetical protein